MIIGIGLDLLEIDRLAAALSRRPKLAQRLFTAGEREFAQRQAHPEMNLAARFCAKEAVAKALSLKVWSFLDVEVVGGGSEPPAVKLVGHVGARCNEIGAQIQISLTHTDRTAGAVAIASSTRCSQG